MKIKQLSLENFRNYSQLDLNFENRLTLLIGKNAQGKTNILEAIFLLSLATSHRSKQEAEMIKWGENFARIQGLVERSYGDLPLELTLSSRGKVAKVNYLEQAKLSQFIGNFNVVLFAPENLQLVKGSPSLRRKFLDSEIGQAHPVYLQDLLDYNRLLKQRNNYLKNYGMTDEFDAIYLEVLTEQVVEKAVTIIRERIRFIDRLTELARVIHQEIAGNKEELQLIYQASSSKLNYSDFNNLASEFMQLFLDNRQRELKLGYTVLGPHRDDFLIYLNQMEAQYYASQGQQRTIVLSLKLAELELLKESIGEYPVLLLDDVMSELDANRQQLLLEIVNERVQTFITTTHIDELQVSHLTDMQILRVDQGQVVND